MPKAAWYSAWRSRPSPVRVFKTRNGKVRRPKTPWKKRALNQTPPRTMPMKAANAAVERGSARSQAQTETASRTKPRSLPPLSAGRRTRWKPMP